MKNFKVKYITTLISIIVLGILLVFYFLDNSLEWGPYKIVSCIFVCIWGMFIPQTVTYYFYKIRNSDLTYSFRLGLSLGTRGFIGLLITPYYGIKFYFVDLNEIKYNGELFL